MDAAFGVLLSSSSSAAEEPACPRLQIDLKVMKESRNRAPDPAIQRAVLQAHPKQWSLSRHEVPYSLTHKAITIDDWTYIFYEADALWEKRAMALREVMLTKVDTFWEKHPMVLREVILADVSPLTLYPRFNFIIYMVLFASCLAFTFLISYGDMWWKLALLCLLCLFLICFLPFLVGALMLTTGHGKRLSLYSGQVFETLAEFEDAWSRLADELRRKLQSHHVDVVPLKEFMETRGRCHVWTVGLRFSFDIVPSASSRIQDCCWPMLNNKNVPSTPSVAAIHDLDHLLQLYQTGDVESHDYQLLKSRILSKMVLPLQFDTLLNISHVA